MQTLTLGHSPDPDDAFLFYGMTTNKIDLQGLRFEHTLQDIETLNQRSLRGELDVTAVSVHAYAYITDRYALLPYGASVGEKYGPILVSKRDLNGKLLGEMKIASPGPRTTAHLAMKMYGMPKEVCFAPFDKIMDLVASRKVDAGLLIHEGQLTFGQNGFVKMLDLGEWWYEKTELPLPLGVNVVNKRLTVKIQQLVARLLQQSLEYALAHRQDAIAYAMNFGRGLKRDLTDRFVSMYVNQYAQDLGVRGRRGIEQFFKEAKRQGLIPSKAKIEIVQSYEPSPSDYCR